MGSVRMEIVASATTKNYLELLAEWHSTSRSQVIRDLIEEAYQRERAVRMKIVEEIQNE